MVVVGKKSWYNHGALYNPMDKGSTMIKLRCYFTNLWLTMTKAWLYPSKPWSPCFNYMVDLDRSMVTSQLTAVTHVVDHGQSMATSELTMVNHDWCLAG